MTHKRFNIIIGGLIIIAFYCAGDWLQRQFALPVPGSVIGMLLMLGYLMCRSEIPASLNSASHSFINHLTLLLIPSCAGLMTCIDTFKHQGLLIAMTIVLSILISIIITRWVFSLFKGMVTAPIAPNTSHQATDRS